MAITTKEQERKALAQIRKIVEGLGEFSYVATAFEGCFEDAEQNIEYDFGCSMKQRADAATKKADDLEKKVAELEHQLKKKELDERDLRLAIEKVKAEDSETITALRQQIISDDDLEDLRQLVSNHEYEQAEAAAKAAQDIVKYADSPSSKEFSEAVRLHRAYTSAADYSKGLKQRIEAAQAARRSN